MSRQDPSQSGFREPSSNVAAFPLSRQFPLVNEAAHQLAGIEDDRDYERAYFELRKKHERRLRELGLSRRNAFEEVYAFMTAVGWRVHALAHQEGDAA